VSATTVRPRTSSTYRPTRVEVRPDAIRHNVLVLRRAAGDAQVCAVVKADGYGHGAVTVARAAVDAGATWLGVALVEEGLQLREAGIDAPVLLLSEPPVAAVPDLLAADLTPVAYRSPFLAALDAAGHHRGDPIPVHLKVDTGMGRVGAPAAGWSDLLRHAAVSEGLHVEGLLTHLARADEPDAGTTDEQLDGFDRVLSEAAKLGLHPRWRHAANSAGTLLHPRARHTLVRPGIAVYGLSPDLANVRADDHELEPALRLVTEVTYAKHVPLGTPVSYGHRWYAPADGWLATLPIGYADGVPRALTNVGQVLLDGRRRPFAGTVCMDQLVVWCGDDEPHVGDEAVLLGDQGDDRILVEEWAALVDTITYEIVTQLTARLPRVVVGVPDHDPAGRTDDRRR
jgi:alanine racemase